MQRYISMLAALSLGCAANIAFAKQDDNSRVANICAGQVENCSIGNVSVGKAGDRFSFTPNVPTANLQRITKSQKITIAIAAAGQKVIAFTPTEGPQKDKQIKVLFYAFDLGNMPQGLSNPNTYQEATRGKIEYPWAKTMLKVFRQLAGETQWTELITSFSDDTFDKMKPFAVEVFPDARAIIQSPAHKDPQGKSIPATTMTLDLAKVF